MKKFNRFVTDVKNGIKRRLSSRRLKIQVSVDEFDLLSKKYFLGIKSDIVTFKFKVDPGDKDIVLFILRAYYGLWIEINGWMFGFMIKKIPLLKIKFIKINFFLISNVTYKIKMFHLCEI